MDLGPEETKAIRNSVLEIWDLESERGLECWILGPEETKGFRRFVQEI